jgi:Effector Associated Constant Component 1
MEDIKLKLAIQGEDATEDVAFSLKDWIHQEQISGLKQVSTDDGQTEPGKMGIDPITVLSVVLASKAVVELVKAIHVWIQATRPKVKIKVQFSEGMFVEIDAENLSETDELLEQFLSKVKLFDTEN